MHKHCRERHKDTVEVIVFDPHEADSSMSKDWGEGALLLFVHQEGHEVLNLWHVHISTVISAHQHLQKDGEKKLQYWHKSEEHFVDM